MYDPTLPGQVPANRDNDLLFRQSGMTEEEKKKREKERARLLEEAGGSDLSTSRTEYFTD